ncbi:MAG: hypothetical protein WC521_04340 [Bdellovibrionales bacterium]|jgi:hypothetical protein
MPEDTFEDIMNKICVSAHRGDAPSQLIYGQALKDGSCGHEINDFNTNAGNQWIDSALRAGKENPKEFDTECQALRREIIKAKEAGSASVP